MKGEMKRANWIGAPAFFNLNQACRIITEAYGYRVYLVGSSLTRRDFRDVDVRCILDDDEFERMFPGHPSGMQYDARWSLACSAISLWLAQASGLPIDFQFQKQTEANEKFSQREGHERHAIGIFLHAAAPPEGREGAHD